MKPDFDHGANERVELPLLEPLPLDELPHRPKVSVAVPSYNYGRFLAECLDSCLAQTVRADEIVVVDDGSTDATWEVLQSYASRFAHVRGIRQNNAGVCAATNAAIAACTGDVVLLLDADDLMAPQRVEMVIEALRTPIDGRLPGWVHHALRRFSDTHPDLGLTPHYAASPHGYLAGDVLDKAQSPVATVSSGLAFRRELLAAIGPLDEERVMAQDMQLWLAAALLSPVAWIAQPLARYRMHGVSDSAGGMMSSLPKVRVMRERYERTESWIGQLLQKYRPQATGRRPPLSEQPGFLWLQFLERWWSGGGKDFKLLRKVLRHPQTRAAPLQQRVYLYGSVCLPRPWFMAFSGLIFGASPLKAFVRKCLGRA